MHRWVPSRSLEILFQHLLVNLGWGLAAFNVLQLVLRLLAPASPQKLPLVLATSVAIPFWALLSWLHRKPTPGRETSDSFALWGLGYTATQVLIVTWFVPDPMRILPFFTLLAVAGVFVRRTRRYLLCLLYLLACTAAVWRLAPPPPTSAAWVATQLALSTVLGLLIHVLLLRLMRRVRNLLGRLVEARRAVAELRDLVPICAACKSIRNDDGFWESVESYVGRHTQTPLSHGLCPGCMDRARVEYRRDLEALSRSPRPDLSRE